MIKQTWTEEENVVDRRRKIQTTGQLRREKMVVMNKGERRASDVCQDGQQSGTIAKGSSPEAK